MKSPVKVPNHIKAGVVESEIVPNAANDPVAIAKALGFNPEGFEDLPESKDLEITGDPVTGKLAMEIAETSPGIPPIYKTKIEQDPLPELQKVNDTQKKKPITNVSDAIEPAQFMVNRIGEFPYSADDFTYENDSETSLDGVPFDSVCGRLPYAKDASFRRGIYIKEPTTADAAAIFQACNGQSFSALFNALGRTVNVPYRKLTVADHMHIMYYHLITAYPAQKMSVNWPSSLYGVETDTSAFKFFITERNFTMSPAEWKSFADQGFTLPRVYDIENRDALKTKEEEYLLDIAQFLDPYHPIFRTYIEAAAADGSPNARLQGRFDFLKTQPIRYKAGIDEFKKAIGEYGISEELRLSADVTKITIGDALDYLESIHPRSEVQETEFERLTMIVGITSMGGDETDARQGKFTPVEEGVPLVRSLWRFFPFL